MFEKIKYYFFVKKLIRIKQEILREANLDIRYFETYKSKLISTEFEDKARAELVKLKNLYEKAENKKDIEDRITEVSDDIGEATGARATYYRQLKITKEMPSYLEMLRDELIIYQIYKKLKDKIQR